MAELVLEDLGMSTTDYLQHHGILGQKWGRRNGPPYPLDAGDHSASEKKAGWRQSLAENRDKVKAKVSEIKAASDARKEAKAEEAVKRYEEEKQRILNSGDYAQIAKIKDDLTTNELDAAMRRAETLAKLNQRAGIVEEPKLSRKEERAAKKEAKREAKEEQEARKYEEEKLKIINSGDLKKIDKIKDQLSTNEINAAVNRAEALSKLDDKSRKDAIKSFNDAVTKLGNYVDTGQKMIDVYNKVAKVNNLFNENQMTVYDKDLLTRRAEQERKLREKEIESAVRAGNIEKLYDKDFQKIASNDDVKNVIERHNLNTNLKLYQDTEARRTEDANRVTADTKWATDSLRAQNEAQSAYDKATKAREAIENEMAGYNRGNASSWTRSEVRDYYSAPDRLSRAIENEEAARKTYESAVNEHREAMATAMSSQALYDDRWGNYTGVINTGGKKK